MGKREPRRKRERVGVHRAERRVAVPQPVVREFPAGAPRLRVVIAHDAPEDAQRLCVLYWEVKDNGTWARTVGSLGVTSDVGEVVAAHSHAVLLGCPCATCSEPIAVTNRSWANKVGGRCLDAEAPTYFCPDCTAVERERERQEGERLARLIAGAIADEDAKSAPAGPLTVENPLALALYTALADYAANDPGTALPSLAAIGPRGWTGDSEQDRELLLELYGAGLLAVSAESPSHAFTPSRDGAGLTFSSTEVGWRLVGGPAAARELAEDIAYGLRTRPGPQGAAARDAFAALMDRIDIADITAYLDGRLTQRYGCPEVPYARREELADVIRKGFRHGYTPGQMICFAWRAADSAATWRERNPQVGPPEAASASVTILGGKIDKAIEFQHSIPEYETPRRHQAPLALGAFRRLRADIRRVYDREVIAACAHCDPQGFKETVRAETGARALWRCTHPVEIAIPSQRQETAEPSPVDDTPEPADT
ncbi:hypothetical protein SLA_3907 [Streptomyces laurentii]|uniref:Uncharacterized protein n=1 Tax=Streptomyces laurentii TaxID=39478 RepID=A0A169NNY0_STRLU|nr:hypothetical protein SLA_3907 [Streptomyces laurentii]